jgi:hypothetical protein
MAFLPSAAVPLPSRAMSTTRGDPPHDVDVPLLLDVAIGTLLFRRLRGAATDDAPAGLADLIATGSPPRTTHRRT